MMRLLKMLFCKHEYEVETLYGDKINLYGGCRQLHVCKHCGKEVRKELV